MVSTYLKYEAKVSEALHHILQWLQHHEGFLAYAGLSAAAMVEYIFPPFPGDSVTIFGFFLAHTARYRMWLTYFSVTIGSTLGSCVAYSMGHALKIWPREKMPKWLETQMKGETLERILHRFDTHGNWLLSVNRFIPAFRGIVFFAAGMTSIELWRVLVFGTISAAVWNGVLFIIGSTIARNWHGLSALISAYSYVTICVLAVIAIFFGLRKYFRARKPLG